jgi:tRNA-dihydrouridine synthase C
LLPKFFDASSTYRNPEFAVARTKGWLKQLSFTANEFNSMFEELKVITKPSDFKERLNTFN